jgi:PiT family inorganic phosphate transporter
VSDIVLIVVVLAFAWNLGVHYTGAVMGMAYSARAIALRPALVLIAIFALLGAALASGGVQKTVGLHIIPASGVTKADAIAIVLAGGLLTTLYNYLKVPTSTIQILVFCVIGAGLAAHLTIAWGTIGRLVLIWMLAPPVAVGLGFVFTRLFDLLIPPAAARAQMEREVVPLIAAQRAVAAAGQPEERSVPRATRAQHGRLAVWFPAVAQELPAAAAGQAAAVVDGGPALSVAALRWLPGLLVMVGVAASFVMGANDVSNATGAFIMTHRFSVPVAGLLGGLAMAVGALTWGRRILHTVAFDVVKMDLAMASAAQGVQALVVFSAVAFGYFTSMNQALIGAMAGAGLARGRETVQRRQFVGILRGWAIGPVSGLAAAYLLDVLARALT